MNKADRIDHLLDAIELVKADQREEARAILRRLINDDGDFEDAWLWMSVAVDSIEQSSLCLDNVLRVNPGNHYAAGALYRIRRPQMEMERRRNRYVMFRDAAFIGMWVLIFMLMLLVTMVFATLPVSGG